MSDFNALTRRAEITELKAHQKDSKIRIAVIGHFKERFRGFKDGGPRNLGGFAKVIW